MTDFKNNSFGVAIKMQCSSCAFKDMTRAVSTRYCTKHERSVEPNHVCSLWSMSDQMKMAGRSEGKVKRLEYLRYLLAERDDEQLAIQMGHNIKPRSIEQIRENFESEHGSIYY